MDPNIMKLLEEDEDETMHSGADVEAFTAALNRDIEGDTSTSQPSDSESAALSQGNSHTAGQFLPQWQTSSHEDNLIFRNEQDLIGMEQREQLSSQSQLQQQPSEADNRKEQGQQGSGVPTSQPMGAHIPDKNPIPVQEPENEQNSDRELNLHKLHDSKQPVGMETNNQQPVLMGTGNEQTATMGMSTQQATGTVNEHEMGTAMSSQQAMPSGMSNQQAMASSNQQAGNTLKLGKQVPFGLLLPIIQPQLDKDRAMQLHTLYFKLKKNEISKDGFVRHMRSIVGDQMLKMAVYKLQMQQGTRNSQSQGSTQQQLQMPSNARLPTDLGNQTSDGHTVKLHEVERQIDPHGIPSSQMLSSSIVLNQDRKPNSFPVQGLNKQQQQHLHFSQASFSTYGNVESSYPTYPSTNMSSVSLRLQPQDSQMRQLPTHQNANANQLGPTTQAMNMMNTPKFERPSAFGELKRVQTATPSHTNSNINYVKQEPPDQSNDEQQKVQLSKPQGISSSPVQVEQGNVAPRTSKDECFETHSSRMGFMTPSSTSPPVLRSITTQMENNSSSNTRMSSLTSPGVPGNNSKAQQKKPVLGQKKPLEELGSSPPPSSKKQKVSGPPLNQSIEQLNDVTAVSGVNIREEEEQLFSGPKEDSRVSEASRRVVQEEEERIILHKIPFQKKLAEILAKSGIKSISSDVEKCLSLCVEERMRGLMTNLIRLSKQRVDIEKARHRTIVTSDVRQQIMKINRRAREEWDKKQAETEKFQKVNEPENDIGVDGDKDKDESRLRSSKANREEDDKMRTTAANVAVRAATGVGDMLSRWQLMAEAKQKQGGTDAASGSQPGNDARKHLQTSTRTTRDNQEAEKRGHSAFINAPVVRKTSRNQVVPQVACNISVKDVIAILEREPQMSKSTLIYRLYEKASGDAVGE